MSNIDKIRDYLNGTKNSIKIGYVPALEDRDKKEGDTWVDDSGNAWVIKNGVRVKQPKPAKIIHRKICKECGSDIRFSKTYYLDIDTWNATSLCYECFFKNETKMKVKGTWDEFNNKRELRRRRSIIKEHITKFEEALQWCKDKKDKPIEFINSDGTIEKWEGKEDVESLENMITTDLEDLKKQLEDINAKLKEK